MPTGVGATGYDESVAEAKTGGPRRTSSPGTVLGGGNRSPVGHELLALAWLLEYNATVSGEARRLCSASPNRDSECAMMER
jgi:hypothetical protein